MLRTQGTRQLRHCVADRSSDCRRQHSFARLETSEAEGHLRRKIRDWNPRGAHVIDTLGYQAKVLLSYSKPFAVGPIFRNTIGSGEHHPRTGRKLRSASFLYDARSFVPQNQWRLRSVILARQDSVVQRRRARGSHPHKHLAIRNLSVSGRSISFRSS